MFQSVISRQMGFAAVFAMSSAATLASADEVALAFVDHDLSIHGTLISFENNTYIIETENGQMIVPAEMVECQGEACAPVTTLASN